MEIMVVSLVDTQLLCLYLWPYMEDFGSTFLALNHVIVTVNGKWRPASMQHCGGMRNRITGPITISFQHTRDVLYV